MMSGLSLSAWAHTTPHEFQTKSCHSTQRKITLLFNYVGPHSASQFPFFNYVRSQRIRRTRWSHKPTQRIKIFLLESREPAQRITITILLLPTQSATILLINHVSPHSASRLLFFCYPPRTEQFSSFKHVSSYSASRLLFFLLPTHYPFFCCPHGAKRSSSSKHLSPHCASRFIFFRYPPRS